MGDQNAFENGGQLPLFETIQRALDDEGVEDGVASVLRDIPPDQDEALGIAANIQNLKDKGLWATARFYEKLLEKRDLQE